MTQIFDLGSRRRDNAETLSRWDGEGAGDESDPGSARPTLSEPPRVPMVFERELKRLAETLREPLSNLLRAVIEDAIAVADHAGANVETRLKTLASSLEHERDKLRRRVMRDPLEGIFAFQPIKLAQFATCAKCAKELRRGEGANLGLQDEPGSPTRRVFVCDGCVPAE